VRDGVHYVAYRSRRPVDDGRGGDVVVARVAGDGRLDELCRIDKRSMDAESLERPALVTDGTGRWRLYLSCATTGTRHWRVELLQADSPDAFNTAGRRVVMPGDEHVAMKDPVSRPSSSAARPLSRSTTGVGMLPRTGRSRTGIAAGRPARLAAVGEAPVAQASGAYPAPRYAAVVDDGDRTAVYYEIGCDDGSHELRREWFARTS
jgi:hypothetical protein